jgi:phosphate starvation-inducible PhoH-like protein
MKLMPKRYPSKKPQNGQKFNSNPLLKPFKARTKNQSDFIRAISENDAIFCSGPAGCGKTHVSVGYAITKLMDGEIDKILICRPIVEASRKSFGSLPGGIRDKVQPYIRPLYDELAGYVGKFKLEELINLGVIDICPLELMRGCTFDNTIMILDEAQNAEYDQIKLFVTRIGVGSKAIINGDPNQSDLPYSLRDGFIDFFDYLSRTEGVKCVKLTELDIQRHDVVKRILFRLNEVENDHR